VLERERNRDARACGERKTHQRVREKSTARRTREGIVFEEGNIKRAADAVLREPEFWGEIITPANPPARRVLHIGVYIPTNQLVVFPEPIKERQRDLFFSNNRAQHKPSGTHRQKHLITHACSLTSIYSAMYIIYV
jgi:hypothetical protein